MCLNSVKMNLGPTIGEDFLDEEYKQHCPRNRHHLQRLLCRLEGLALEHEVTINWNHADILM